MSKINKSKIRHHYIPKFYLKGFTDADPDDPVGKLCVYSKNKKHYSEVLCGVSPDAIAFEKHGYTVRLPDGTMDSETVENIFAEKESKTAPLLKKIISGQKLTKSEFSTFVSDFLAIMAIRTPTTRNTIKPIAIAISRELALKAENKDSFREYINNCVNDGCNIKLNEENMETERLKYIGINERYAVMDSQGALMLSLSIHENINEGLQKAHWQVIGPVKEYKFLTSDNPFISYGKNTNERTFLMPLSKEYCILGSPSPNFKRKDFTKKANQIVKEINSIIVKFAGRNIYCHFKAQSIYDLVKKYKDFTHGISELKE